MIDIARPVQSKTSTVGLERVRREVSDLAWERARALLACAAACENAGAWNADEFEALRHEIESALVAEQDWTAATIRWRAALRDFPDEPVLWPFAARCFIQAHAYEDAEPVLLRIAEAYPDDADNWMYAAVNAEHLHNWSVAVERWNRVVALRPTDPNMKTLRGAAIWNAEMLAWDKLSDEQP